jgi:tetratricopeptide (TPR) repeat protein
VPQTVLTIFLSSTAKDLTAYRNEVHARLSRIGYFHCVWQEDFGAQDSHAVAYCREQAKKADIYVGFIGLRRGWEPHGDSKARSITEMEHDWAEEAGHPRLLYVSPDNFPVPGDLRDSDAAHRRQLDFRKRMMAKRIVSQAGFESPEKLATNVVERLLKHVIESGLAKHFQGAATPTEATSLPDDIAVPLTDIYRETTAGQHTNSEAINRDVVIELARRLKPEEALDIGQALAELRAAVDVAADVMKKGKLVSNFDDIVNTVRARIAERTAAGEFDRAAKEVDDALAELDLRETEQRQALQRSRVSLLEAGVEQDILRRDAPAVAQRVARIASTEEPDDSTKRFEALRRRQDEFYVEGRDKGLNFSLQIAIEIAALMLHSALDVSQRGTALNHLGIALSILGERETGTARLEEAVDAFRNALLEHTRERVPLDWAMTQNNLGNALTGLGERESGTVRLEEAVAAFHKASLECTRERVPLDWATTQSNLGNALQALGERETGTARLEEAVDAFRNALLEHTRERVPFDWAMTQNNLGNALRALGERETGTVRLEEAVLAHRNALLECTRERVPLDWAATQNNLGNALQALGEREPGTARLEEAVAAFRNALLEYTRERVPLDWAMTQNNLGNVLQALGEREIGTARQEEAVLAFRDALLERTRERVPLDWASTQNNLGIALGSLGEREIGTARLEEAVAAFSAAVEIFQHSGASHYLALTRQNLTRVDAEIASRRTRG